ncbi:MAG: metal-dependent transcriptional regulator [Planctomycetes bacterium]|nr:metal-dependent transcriptional regulator [Planctomycetota bacterium]
MPSKAAEDYLKHIFLLHQRAQEDLVPMGDLAESMGVVPGTATSMVKKLNAARLVNYEAYSGVKLTAKGRRIALQVLRRHRIIETLLVKTFGLDWSEVHDEAEQLEHTISDRLLERIDVFLGHPTTDPHGDPIPSAQGQLPKSSPRRLSDCSQGEKVTICRIVDQDQDFLRFIEQHGLKPGSQVQIDVIDEAGDSIRILPERKKPLIMGSHAARKLLVESSG